MCIYIKSNLTVKNNFQQKNEVILITCRGLAEDIFSRCNKLLSL